MAARKRRREPDHKSHALRRIIFILIILVVVGGGVKVWLLPLPKLSANVVLTSIKSSPVNLPWPAYGESAIGAEGYGVLATHGSTTTELPTASVAKIITTLTVLKKYPLSLGQQGPTLTMGAADVASYNSYVAEDGSVIKVAAGEQLSEYQAIEAMLLPSANNMADSLATWAFGSLAAYDQAANQMLASIGMTHTVVSNDASGFLPGTKSTASDLVLLGQAAIQNPVVAQIVSEKQATLPVAGVVNNVNWLLGQDDIIGIKTGNTQQAGGVYLFAVKHALSADESVTIIGSIMGAATLQQALDNSVPLIQVADQGFQLDKLLSSGQTIGYYKNTWDNQITNAIASDSITVPVWQANIPTPTTMLDSATAGQGGNSQVGKVSFVVNGSTFISPVVLSHSINSPTWYWRLSRHR